jgi:hypothetical protein
MWEKDRTERQSLETYWGQPQPPMIPLPPLHHESLSHALEDQFAGPRLVVLRFSCAQSSHHPSPFIHRLSSGNYNKSYSRTRGFRDQHQFRRDHRRPRKTDCITAVQCTWTYSFRPFAQADVVDRLPAFPTQVLP